MSNDITEDPASKLEESYMKLVDAFVAYQEHEEYHQLPPMRIEDYLSFLNDRFREDAETAKDINEHFKNLNSNNE